MKKAERIQFIDKQLNRLYPKPQTFLKYKTMYQLLVAVILSAQCTDKRVNEVTAKLFSQRPGPRSIVDLGREGLIGFIRPCGLFNTKSKNILSMSKGLIEKYGGQVPDDYDELIKLAGVGQKTADVLLAQGFGKATFPVDTHIHRLAHRLGLSKLKDPNKVAGDLKRLFPEKRWNELHIQFIFHGREVCHARGPSCYECSLLPVCPFGKKRINK